MAWFVRLGRLVTTARGTIVAAAMVTTSLVAASAGAQITGAVSTTSFDGLLVNGNLYSDARGVYFSGGPQNRNAAGLTPGIYFFQVTTRDGSVLVSTDLATDRLVYVDSYGRVGGRCLANGAPIHSTRVHPEGAADTASGAVPVRLWPFASEPSGKGDYKAWLILAAAWDGSEYIADPNTSIAADGRHLSFLQRDSRTDNFTFRATSSGVPVAASEFNGAVFDDLNANGVLEPSDLPLGGATVRCTLILPDGSETSLEATSDLSGNYFLTTEGLAGGLPSGTAFRVTQVPLGGAWTQTAPAPDGFGDRYYSGILGSGLGFFYGLDFGNTS